MRGASRTAEFMALFRALESARPRRRRLFHDPLARRFLAPSLRPLPILARLPPLGRVIAAVLDRRWPGARASGIARTRLIDEQLREALASGVDQVVIVGAGFDARAYRMPELEGARVFELDQPATLTRKRAAVAELLGAPPGHVSFVEVDLNRTSVAAALEAAGLSRSERVFFIWEGVSNYLSAAGVDSTLRSVRDSGAPGSCLAFTYVHEGVLDGSVRFPGAARTLAKVKSSGEPWTFGLDPARLQDYLAERGLRLLEDLGSVEYRAMFMPAGGRHMRGYEFYRVALAEIAGRYGG
jgi:methyltransferase (TIGR00027 family)